MHWLPPLRTPAASLRAPKFASGQKDPKSPSCSLTRAAGGTGLLRCDGDDSAHSRNKPHPTAEIWCCLNEHHLTTSHWRVLATYNTE